ncbi:FMN-dependent L-lactate dehydrogenase LldD [Polymorphobacter sp.]|uniref:FMN-dependent L-lactate dehydrogenase LldD n=1 Tax=Polymorphobacter sp. TaxID=1909290 RepID=UPI003F726F24
MIIASASDFRAAARQRLPRFLFDYIDGAAYAEVTSRRNVDDLAAISLRQRVLNDVSQIDTATTLFGQACRMPVALGPVGLSGMYARRGEVQAMRAATDAGIPLCLSTVSVCSVEEVAASTPVPPWFQLYVIRDRAFMRDLLARARAIGCGALVFTVDMPVPGARYRDPHSGMSGPNAALRRFAQALMHPSWALDVGVLGRPHNLGNIASILGHSSGLEDFIGWLARNFDPAVRWQDLGWIREHWDGPLIIKGILDPDDAAEAVALGADGIIVSNHGGRQLDGVVSSARALPDIAARCGDSLTVMADGGVRSGLDVVRMLALGARGVFLGRAWSYALAARGGAGVAQLLAIIEAEMRVAMALTGCTSIDSIGPQILDRRGAFQKQD